MANIFKLQSLVFFNFLILFQSLLCLPTPDNGLIDGNEFLSLFIGPSKTRQNVRYESSHQSSSSNYRPPSSNNFDEDELKESIISVESILANDDEILMQDSSNYGLRLHNRSRNQKFIPKSQRNKSSPTTHPSSSSSSSNKDNSDYFHTEENSGDNPLNIGKPKKQIIKMVTSGSKIIFLEEVTPKENLSQNFTVPINTQFHHNNNRKYNSTPSTSSDDEDVQVLSISVSSTVGKSHHNSPVASKIHHHNKHNNNNHQHRVTKTHELVHLQPLDVNIENNNNPLEDDDKSIDFINRSHKSEFSIEEAEPVTHKSFNDRNRGSISNTAVDSINGESTNLHRIVAPPVNPINQSMHYHKNMTTVNGSAHIQRRQDKLLPFQTVIYHDSGFNKDGNAQPRSVSYSSIAQSVDEINSWKELDSLIQVRQSVNESLHNPNFSEKIKLFEQNSPRKMFSEPARLYSEPAKIYGEPSKIYSEPAKVYSEPSKVYGEPEKQYGEPSKVYSEPSKVYSEPAKVYSEPAKVYGEPSKVYWPRISTTTISTPTVAITTPITTKNPTNSRRIIFNLDKLPYDLLNAPQPGKQLLEPDSNKHQQQSGSRISTTLGGGINNSPNFGHHLATRIKSPTNTSPLHQISQIHQNFPSNHHRNLVTEKPNISISSSITESPPDIYTPTPEQNYEIEESVSVMTNGRAHGIQHSTQKGISTLNPQSNSQQHNGNGKNDDDSKVGYVVEGRNYRKYRVEEKTSDGFIVGEYGVVSHNDGSLRGVRYTADSTINPSLIHEALMKFLSL